jgi:hypothetical protein
MRFQIEEELSPNDFERIKNAEKIEKMLYDLHDSAWLSEDLSSFDYIFWSKFKGNARSIVPIEKSLGWFVDTDEELSRDFFFPNLKRNCFKKPHTEMHLQIGVDNSINPAGIRFLIYGNRIARLFFGPFFSIENENYFEGSNNRIIFEVAKYFYSRKSQYIVVHDCLLKYKEEFTKVFGEKFIEDLILLFSASIISEAIPNFNFSERVIKEPIFCQKILKNDLSWEMPALKQPSFTKQFTWSIPFMDTEIYLTEKNTVKIFSDCRDKNTTFPRGINTDKFPIIRANDALKQIVAFADFGMKIYEKVKNRIFVENI